MKNYLDIIVAKLKEKNTSKILVAIGIFGMLLVLLSGMFTSGEEKSVTSENGEINLTAYKKNIEDELSDMLSEIDGVGRNRVMVTLSSGEEYIFAEETKTGNSAMQKSYVIVEKNGEKQALVSRVDSPKVSGVIIVCEGGGNAVVREEVYKAVSTVLGIPLGDIYVTKIS
ncbi:MAG: hypothetical protein E7507_00775 [Ruminococcus sp.]|nr:hypothetical protein [Ruminococcus sp.]